METAACRHRLRKSGAANLFNPSVFSLMDGWAYKAAAGAQSDALAGRRRIGPDEINLRG